MNLLKGYHVRFDVPFVGNVKKSGMMKIVHEKYRSTKKVVHPVISQFQSSFHFAVQHNKDLEPLLNKAQVYSLICTVTG